MLPADMEQLSRLRRAIAKSEALPEETRSLALGVPAIDAALGGGLPGAALHEVSATPLHLGAAASRSGSRPISAASKPACFTVPASTSSGFRPSGC